MQREITRSARARRRAPRAAGRARQLQDRGAHVQHGGRRLQEVPQLPAQASLPAVVQGVPMSARARRPRDRRLGSWLRGPVGAGGRRGRRARAGAAAAAPARRRPACRRRPAARLRHRRRRRAVDPVLARQGHVRAEVDGPARRQGDAAAAERSSGGRPDAGAAPRRDPASRRAQVRRGPEPDGDRQGNQQPQGVHHRPGREAGTVPAERPDDRPAADRDGRRAARSSPTARTSR